MIRRSANLFVFVSSIDVSVKMASSNEELCTNYADFAVICSFIDKFGEKIGSDLPNIGELQACLEDTENGSCFIMCLFSVMFYKTLLSF